MIFFRTKKTKCRSPFEWNATNLSNSWCKPNIYIINVIDQGVSLQGTKIKFNATPQTYTEIHSDTMQHPQHNTIGLPCLL